jgi:hypothetical protein
MRSCFGIGFLLSILGVVAATNAAPPKAPPAQASLDADKLAPGAFAGTVVSIPNSERVITVEVVYQKIQLKPGQNLGRANQNLQREYNHIMQLQAQMMRPPSRGSRGHPGHNPMQTMQQLQNAMVQFQNNVARTQANMFQVINAKQKVDFQMEENVKVRMLQLPEQFDDKGNIKQYTREEKDELKGKDKKLPGYESSIDSLKPGQIVQVVLAVHKKPRPTPPSSSTADKTKDSEKDKVKEIATDKPKDNVKDTPKEVEKDKDMTVQHRLQVRTIVIVKDSDSSASPSNPSKKKRK